MAGEAARSAWAFAVKTVKTLRRGETMPKILNEYKVRATHADEGGSERLDADVTDLSVCEMKPDQIEKAEDPKQTKIPGTDS